MLSRQSALACLEDSFKFATFPFLFPAQFPDWLGKANNGQQELESTFHSIFPIIFLQPKMNSLRRTELPGNRSCCFSHFNKEANQ
jgi:hypothetical protein